MLFYFIPSPTSLFVPFPIFDGYLNYPVFAYFTSCPHVLPFMVAACYLVHLRHLPSIWCAPLSLFSMPCLVDADAALIYTRFSSHSPLVYPACGSLYLLLPQLGRDYNDLHEFPFIDVRVIKSVVVVDVLLLLLCRRSCETDHRYLECVPTCWVSGGGHGYGFLCLY
ncbi:hypothetical protein BDW74DRAFT_15805 [Aspergillus multicolor]|uniref:uncharacterized protein n=1 Tax=Aspergillus multicolor TaxID=41759 RepID=UPI003CCC99B3